MSVMTLLREVGSPLTIFNLKWRKRTKPFDTGDIENRRWLGWTDSTYHDELARRKKHQQIRKGQRQFLKNTLQAYPKHHKLICEMYKISNATYQRIKREYEDYWYEESIKSCTGDSEKKNWEMARIIIQKLVTPPWAPTTIEEIRQRIWQDLNVMYSPHTIKAFVKKELRWSYKKGCPRPNKYKTKKIWVSKALFCIDLINLMSERRLIINIDESSFDRSMKREYSWLPIGRSSALLNQNITGKSSLILEVSNRGSWFALVKESTMNARWFWIYLKLIEKAFRDQINEWPTIPVVIIDNAPTHTAKLTKKIADTLSFEIKYLPPYWPEVEQAFNAIKSKFKSRHAATSIKFDSERGAQMILDLISSIQLKSWLDPWLNVCKEWRTTILKTVQV